MELVGESIAATSVPLDAILKIETLPYLTLWGKAVRKCCLTCMKMDLFQTKNITKSNLQKPIDKLKVQC